jgi:hypothetical protein
MHVVSLAERPELADAAFGIPSGPTGGTFMQASPVPLLVRRRRLVQRWPDHVLVLLDDDEPVARGVSVPFCAAGEGREPFPDGGWDQIAIWVAEDALDGREPDTACALEIRRPAARPLAACTRTGRRADRRDRVVLGHGPDAGPRVDHPRHRCLRRAQRVGPAHPVTG